jgi:hypothetical protein
VGGSIKRFQNKGPDEPRNPALPPKPKGQTVGSFDLGLRTLTDAIGRNVKDTIRYAVILVRNCNVTDSEHLALFIMDSLASFINPKA